MSFLFKILVAIALAEAPAPVSQTLDKIDVLVINEKWAEAISSLKDVSSGEKGERYSKLVERAAIGYVRSEDSKLSEADQLADSLLKSFTTLRTSPFFQNERNRISQLGFSKCFNESKDKEECVLRLYARIEKEPARTDFNLWGAMQIFMARRTDLTYKALLLTAQAKDRKKVCESDVFLDIAVPSLSKPDPYDENFQKLLKSICWKEIKGKLAKKLDALDSEPFRQGTCQIFKEMKMAHPKCNR